MTLLKEFEKMCQPIANGVIHFNLLMFWIEIQKQFVRLKKIDVFIRIQENSKPQ